MLPDQHPMLSDAYPPREIARRVEDLGVAKARISIFSLLVLAVLAGAFISLGSIFYLTIISDIGVSAAWVRWLGGIAFSLGLVLVVIAGAELFTGNNLVAMAWVSGKISTRELLRNWLFSYIGNVLGCLLTALLISAAGVSESVDLKLEQVIQNKIQLNATEAIAKGILCNAMVCLAVWLSMGGRSVVDKLVVIVFAISAFVALGFEHSIANWFFFPLGIIQLGAFESTWSMMFHNLLFVSIGNIVGGTLLVALVYWLAYLRSSE